MSEALPRAYATVAGAQAMFVAPDGQTEPIIAAAHEDIRHIVVRRAADEARRSGTTLELITSGDRGEHHLLVSATGEISPATGLADATPAASSTSASRPADEVPGHGMIETPSRSSFIVFDASRTPATGWRQVFARLSIRIPESATQLRRRELLQLICRHWAGYRNVAVANGKGGVGKTMTAAMLAAVFARYGGGNVLAWDNNDTRGTLGWRTEQGPYDTTIRDLLPAAAELLSLAASVSDISRFVHHQSADRYDVLRSNPELLAADQRIEADDFDLLMRVATHYYRLLIFDSGNDESADRWIRMIDASHQLVVPTLPSPESAESAALLLEALRNRDDRSAELADNAIVVVTQPEAGSRREAARVASAFSDQVRVVETVPFDDSLKSGPLRFDALHRKTQDAWIRVAGAVAAGLD